MSREWSLPRVRFVRYCFISRSVQNHAAFVSFVTFVSLTLLQPLCP